MSARELINLLKNGLFQYLTVATENVACQFTLCPYLTSMRVNLLAGAGCSLQTILVFFSEIHSYSGNYVIAIGNGQKLLRLFAEIKHKDAFKESLEVITEEARPHQHHLLFSEEFHHPTIPICPF